MNISEKKRAELYVQDYTARKVSAVPYPKATNTASAEVKAAHDAVKKATAALKALGWEIHHYNNTLVETGKSLNSRTQQREKKQAIMKVAAQDVIRRIWNNDVTFDNIDEALESALGN